MLVVRGSTYDFTHEDHILSSNEEHPSCDISVSVADEYSLYCILQDEVGCKVVKKGGDVVQICADLCVRAE